MRSISIALDRPAAKSLGMTVAFAGLTAVLAQASVRLPFTPVPVTLQVLAVILSGLVLGSRLGAVAQLEYLAVAFAGAPICAEHKTGIMALAGPTGGYLPGFVLGAFVTGLIFERLRERNIFKAFLAGMSGVGAIYFCGSAWLTIWLSMTGQAAAISAWLLGALPFVGVDAVKATVAAIIASKMQR